MKRNMKGTVKSKPYIENFSGKRACRTRRRPHYLSVPNLIIIFTLLILLAGVLLGSSLNDVLKTQAAEERALYKYYTSVEIQKDDTLWKIASRYNKNAHQNQREYIAEIKRLNHMDTDQIHSGRYLLVPYYSEKEL